MESDSLLTLHDSWTRCSHPQSRLYWNDVVIYMQLGRSGIVHFRILFFARMTGSLPSNLSHHPHIWLSLPMYPFNFNLPEFSDA